MHLLWDFCASEAPDTFNLEIWLFVEDAHLRQAVLSEVIKPLQESLHQVLGLVEDLTFTPVFVVMEEPEGVSIWVKLLLECLHTATGLVLVVDHERLEVEEIPVAWWQSVKWIDVFLLLLFLLLFSLRLLLCGSFLLLFL